MQKAVEKPERPEPPQRRTLMLLLPLALFGILAALFGYALRTADPSKLPSALIGRSAPSTELPPLEGSKVGGVVAADFTRGDVVVVNFWASWCGPCVQEHPLLADLKTKTGARLIGIDHKDPAPGGLRFLTRLGNPYDAIGVDANGRASIEWGVYGMPETFVIDGQGRIVFKYVGPLTPEVLADKVVPAVNAAKLKKS